MYVNELYLLTNHPVFIGLKQHLPICSLLVIWAELSGNGPLPQGVSWVPAHVCIQLTVHSLIHLCSSWLEAWRLLGYETLTTQQAVWAHSYGGSFRVPKSSKKKQAPMHKQFSSLWGLKPHSFLSHWPKHVTYLSPEPI